MGEQRDKEGGGNNVSMVLIYGIIKTKKQLNEDLYSENVNEIKLSYYFVSLK